MVEWGNGCLQVSPKLTNASKHRAKAGTEGSYCPSVEQSLNDNRVNNYYFVTTAYKRPA